MRTKLYTIKMTLSKEDQREIKQETTGPQVEKYNVPNKSKKWVFIGIAFVAIILIGIFSISNSNKPGPLDDFAKCLSEKDVVMYGALSWCQYTQAQKAMFGSSFKYLNYVEYTDFPEEEFGKIRKTPTWIIHGETYENVLSFDRLAQLSGCKL